MQINMHKKENIYFCIMAGLSALIYGCLLAFLLTQGIAALITLTIYIGIFVVFQLVAKALLLGFFKGNAIKVSAQQFPELYAVLQQHAQALELKQVPDMYLVQGNGLLNAFAVRLFKKNFVVLYTDIMEIAYKEGMDAVSFIIGHELGHIKQGHVGPFKHLMTLPASFIPFLGLAYSRSREYTCDNIGFALCPQGAHKGLLVLGAGKELYKRVSVKELLKNDEHKDFSSTCAELFSTHPQLLKRIASIQQQRSEQLLVDEDLHVSPQINHEHKMEQI